VEQDGEGRSRSGGLGVGRQAGIEQRSRWAFMGAAQYAGAELLKLLWASDPHGKNLERVCIANRPQGFFFPEFECQYMKLIYTKWFNSTEKIEFFLNWTRLQQTYVAEMPSSTGARSLLPLNVQPLSQRPSLRRRFDPRSFARHFQQQQKTSLPLAVPFPHAFPMLLATQRPGVLFS
jgi:hypothetical protein